jgi:NADP-dependent 3-hydroxy acid dehydrogenase YdfG
MELRFSAFGSPWFPLSSSYRVLSLLCRTESRASTAIESVKKEIPNANLEYIQFDLMKMKSAKSAAEEFLRRESRLDILVNNAGIVSSYIVASGVGSDGFV